MHVVLIPNYLFGLAGLVAGGAPNIHAAGHKPVELLDGIFPGKRIRTHAREILHLVLDHGAILQPYGDFGRHFRGI